mmetsp:Transcript_41853/g.105561  ORF Transcript_41853/g.105561 Transcript_41853/m.105561 type:complete len:522 (-) Transcript_41853:123-1688(-)|eukprot:CAMPEP_0177647762 /NCGR_PEP_ID=MMETSP0447-20121125/10472_1 /TAXON_ID=0 /ORGANISM="Stygamoeba regulata, Strain BSH-02190019" /LENGTH=521 /DNA_ID=CAMNT_0019150367 /DNA_START=108 /DNA_END=1673 /DNA_ORIENTATION=+
MAVPFSFGGESLRSFLALGGPSRSARSPKQIPSHSPRSTETSRQYASSRSPEPHSPTLAQQVEHLETSPATSLPSAPSKSPLLSVAALTSLPTLPHFTATATTTTTTTTSEVPRSPGTLHSDPQLGHRDSVPLSDNAASQAAHSFEHLQAFLHRAKQPTFLEDAYARQFLRSAAQLYAADSELGPRLRRTVASPPDTVAFASAMTASLRALAQNTAAAQQQQQQQTVPVSQLPRDALGRPVRDLSSAPSGPHSFPTSDATAASALACLAEVSTATRPPRQNVRNPSLLSVNAQPSQRFERLTPAAQQHLALLWSWMPLLEQLSPANKTAIWHTCDLVPDFQTPPAHKRSLFGVAVDHWVNSGDSRSLSVLFGAVGYLKHHNVLKLQFYYPNTTVPVFRAATVPASDGDTHLSLGVKRKQCESEHRSPEENLRRVKLATTTTGAAARWTVPDHPSASCSLHSDDRAVTSVGYLPGCNSLCSDGSAVASFGSSPVLPENECAAAASSTEKRSDKMNMLSILNF